MDNLFQFYSDLRLVIAYQSVFLEITVYFHVEHVKGATDHTAQEVAVPEGVARRAADELGWEHDKVSERVLSQYQAELSLAHLVCVLPLDF